MNLLRKVCAVPDRDEVLCVTRAMQPAIVLPSGFIRVPTAREMLDVLTDEGALFYRLVWHIAGTPDCGLEAGVYPEDGGAYVTSSEHVLVVFERPKGLKGGTVLSDWLELWSLAVMEKEREAVSDVREEVVPCV